LCQSCDRASEPFHAHPPQTLIQVPKSKFTQRCPKLRPSTLGVPLRDLSCRIGRGFSKERDGELRRAELGCLPHDSSLTAQLLHRAFRNRDTHQNMQEPDCLWYIRAFAKQSGLRCKGESHAMMISIHPREHPAGSCAGPGSCRCIFRACLH
jgi:hypothetical protein